MELKVAEIRVGERMRKTFEGMEELAASIAAYGQIEPIVIDENNVLIAGERRLRAHLLLKKETILVVYRKDLNELQKKEIELEENIQRENFTWQEEVAAKLDLHRLKQQIHGAAVKGHATDGKWDLRDTATALGESVGTVSMDIQLAKGLSAFPELLKEKSKTAAYKKLKQSQERVLNAELARRITSNKAITNPDVICGNCIDEMQKMADSSVDLILTDPPYGINIENAHTFKSMNATNVDFNDTDFDTFDLLDKAFKEMYRILKSNRHMYMFFAIQKYEAITTLLHKHGFEVHAMPLIWDKGSGSYPSQMTTYVHSYEPFLHCRKGDRKLNGTPRDVFPCKRVPNGQKIHPTQKPTELLRDLIGFSTNPGEVVFDAFAGSGATLVAAKECQRRAIGIELNPVYHKAICDRLAGVKVGRTAINEASKTIEEFAESEDVE